MIDVDYLGQEPTYSTLEEATAIAARNAAADREDSERVRGRTIVDHSYRGDALFLMLSDGTVLRVWAWESGVRWQLLEGDFGGEAGLPEELGFRFPNGSELQWRWKAILDGMRGRRIRYIGKAGETMVVLYVQGCPDMLFSVLMNRASRKRILFFDEE